VSALCRRIVLRSAGQTISGLEYSVRYQDVLAQYNSWVQAHQNQFDEAIAAAQAQAMQIGWPVTTVVATAYQEAWDMSDPVALQNITLQTPNGQQAAFSVEMESWRVLAISFSDDFINGITADANNAGTDADLATDAQKPRNEALLRQTAYTALKQYFDYTPAVGDAVTLSPAGDADDEGSGWELVVAQPKGNFRYHVELGINGTLRRAMRTVCGMDFSESCSEYGFPYLNEHPERYHLSAKTLFWLNSGASDADGQTLPPEVLSAMAAADAYIRDKGLPFSQHTGYSLSWVDRWLLQREGDIGIEFTYRKGEGDQGYRLVYSTLQQAISAVDFGDTGIALQNGSL